MWPIVIPTNIKPKYIVLITVHEWIFRRNKHYYSCYIEIINYYLIINNNIIKIGKYNKYNL